MNFLDFGGLELYDDLLKSYIDKRIFDYTGDRDSNKINFTTDANQVTVTAKGTGIIEIASEEEVKYISLTEDEYNSATLSCNKCDKVIIYDADKLTSLDVSNNQITDIEFLYELPKLEELKVYNNKLDMILFDKLPNLRDVHIYGNPIVDDCLTADGVNTSGITYSVLINTNEYKKLNFILSTLNSRDNKKLGSIVLYPWYELETLIYYSDGNHKECPSADWSSKEVASNSSTLESGYLCKYPRRLRYDSPLNKSEVNKYNVYGRAANTSKYYTDEKLSKAIRSYKDYTFNQITKYPCKNFIEEHGFILNSTNAPDYPKYHGLEFRSYKVNSDSTIEAESILYAIVTNYNNDLDPINWTLKYVTYSIKANSDFIVTSIEEKIHPLEIYNILRRSFERSNLCSTKNWFFGSAIQNTEDFSMCYHSFKDSYVHRIWESAEKGFKIQLGTQDAIYGRQPNWDHFNIIRYDNSGDVGSEVMTPTPEDSSSLHHGDHILAMLLSRGLNEYKYTESDSLRTHVNIMGLIPNASVYACVPGTRSGYLGLGITWEMMTSVDAITTSYNVGTSGYNTTLSAISRYIWGRFGECHIAHCSAGNYGSTYAYGVVPEEPQDNLGNLERYIGAYTTLDNIEKGASHLSLETYPSTTYFTNNTQYGDIPSNSTVVYPNYKYLDSLRYINSSNVIKYQRALSTSINEYGDNDPVFDMYTMALSYFGGTSAASPTACALRCLAKNLYLVRYPRYIRTCYKEDKIKYTNYTLDIYDENRVVKLYSQDGDGLRSPSEITSKGFGMFSEFNEYFKKNLCHIDKYSARVWQGVGRPSFNEDPDDSIDYSISSAILPEVVPGNSLVVGNLYKIQDTRRPNSNTTLVSKSAPVEYPTARNIRLGIASDINQNGISSYIVHTEDGYFIPIRSGNIQLRPYDLDAQYGLRETNRNSLSVNSTRLDKRTDNSIKYPSIVNDPISLSISERKIPDLISKNLPIHFDFNNKTAYVIGDTSNVNSFTVQMNITLSKEQIGLDESSTVSESLVFWILSNSNSSHISRYNAVSTTGTDSIQFITYQNMPIASYVTKSVTNGEAVLKSTGFNCPRRLMFNQGVFSNYIMTWTISPKEIVLYINGEKCLANYVMPGTESPLSGLIIDLTTILKNNKKPTRSVLVYDRVLSQYEIIQNTINLLNKD